MICCAQRNRPIRDVCSVTSQGQLEVKIRHLRDLLGWLLRPPCGRTQGAQDEPLVRIPSV